MRVRWTTVAVLLTAAGLVMMCLAASAPAAEAGDSDDRYCKSRHAADGSGKAPAGAMFPTPSGNFADCPVMEALKREFLLKIIAEGGAAVGESPPGLGKKLSAGEIEGLADYVATHFCGHD